MSKRELTLYHYWRSSSSWRVRWALSLKEVPAQMIHVNLLTGEQGQEENLKRNPMGAVPTLKVTEEGKSFYLTESLAIIQWIEKLYPTPGLFPKDPIKLAKAIQLTETINSGTQPLQNLGTQKKHSPEKEKQLEWAQYWIRRGFTAYEKLVSETSGKFSIGNELSLPDLFLIPQCYNAKRFQVDLKDFPIIAQINSNSLELPSCQASAPDRFEPKTP